MTLIEFLRHMPAEHREPFAKSCDTSLGHLRNVAYGYRPCAAELAVLIEGVSGRQVTRQELCPDNWRRIWPELAFLEEKQLQTTEQQAQGAINSDDQGVAHAA